MSNRRAHVWVSGRVQGVFFRSHTQDAALRRGLKGWVRNLPDGRVEAVFEGDKERVEDMLNWCKSGSPLARVEHLEVREEEYRGDLLEFEIRYPG